MQSVPPEVRVNYEERGPSLESESGSPAQNAADVMPTVCAMRIAVGVLDMAAAFGGIRSSAAEGAFGYSQKALSGLAFTIDLSHCL